MRGNRVLWVALAVSAIAMACDSPAEEPDAGRDGGAVTGDAGRDAGTPAQDSGTPGEDSGTPGEDSGTPGDDAGSDAGTPAPDAGSTAAPVITRVEWQATPACMDGVSSAFMIRVIATDADTAAGMLTYSGSVSSCTGSINAAMSTVICPNFSTYSGTVTVRDPEANMDTATFAFGPCDTGGVDL